jgi:FAD-linked oxidoreductase
VTEWRNWSGSVVARPHRIARPRGLDELATIVTTSSRVRMMGAGHSFMPLCETTGTLLSLSDLEGDIEVSPDRRSVWAPAGWSLARLTEALWQQGLSLYNQGDVNPQSLAGATATGTHGTGETLGSISTQVTGVRLMCADGKIVTCDAQMEPELFQAQRLGLGLLGVVIAMRIDVLPAYHLEERVERWPLEEALERFDELAAASRHMEFWVFPYARHVILKRLHPAEPDGPYRHANDVNEGAFRVACNLSRRVPRLIPTLQRGMMRAIGGAKERIGPAYRIFAQERTVRFEEMEYEVPRAAGLETLREALDHVRKARLPLAFPFEVRTVAADDIWLSPFHAGPCLSISVHQYAGMPWRREFAEVEAVLAGAGGRPHWAKRHSLRPEDAHRLYPHLPHFLAVRRSVDPEGKFVNALFGTLFGIQD